MAARRSAVAAVRRAAFGARTSDRPRSLRARPVSPGFSVLASFVVAAMAQFGAVAGARAGAWTLEAGTGQAIVAGLYSLADKAFDAHRDLSAPVDFEKATGSIFAEYGLTDRLTLIGAGEFGVDRNGGGFSDPAIFELLIGGRLRLWQAGSFVVSAQLSALVDDETDALQRRIVGWDTPAVEARVLAGSGFALGAWPAFVGLEAGYRYRTSLGGGIRQPDELRLDATFGLRPFERVQLLFQDFSTISVRGPQDIDRYDHHKLQGSVVYDLSATWSVQTGGFVTVSGRSALQERGLIAAAWYRF